MFQSDDSESQISGAVRWRNLLVWLEQHGMKSDRNSLLVERRPTPGSSVSLCRASVVPETYQFIVIGAGYGLFASGSCSPSTPVFTVPASCLINIKTLLPHYLSAKSVLSATQLISLHLFLYRPEAGFESSDPLYGPYISILPRDFECHPLTLLVRRTTQVLPEEDSALLDDLPPSVANALHELLSRFQRDWDAVRRYLVFTEPRIVLPLRRPAQSEPDLLFLTTDFLWAWLNGKFCILITGPYPDRCCQSIRGAFIIVSHHPVQTRITSHYARYSILPITPQAKFI